MLFFADSAERAIVQATMMGGVAVVITSTLLLLVFLDHPYQSGAGGLRPVAMERALAQIEQERAFARERIIIPCDSKGTDARSLSRRPAPNRATASDASKSRSPPPRWSREGRGL